ncbi:hypothetical protein [Falsiroseomonas selenitidurans]|uniref:Uncharacterized protein n=1 Tax=Falsiroseomonas selenitidurans TaxID=2716335 RepID=A0ABX1DX00_9PROT|nr:hypothetical protein [Falsiroseomonas selenitidurans]NKC29432.1 hypothetical protein [Falsiroseomonas selenitidurans]
MGGLFQAPKPVVSVQDTAAATEAANQAVAEQEAASAASAEDAARQARQRALERARRGLAGTIATSARGVLDPAPAFAARKTLLGE